MNDNELAYLESIHFFVELLDTYFKSVCELDLVFHVRLYLSSIHPTGQFYKVYAILDELYLAGEIQETSKSSVLQRLESLDKMD